MTPEQAQQLREILELGLPSTVFACNEIGISYYVKGKSSVPEDRLLDCIKQTVDYQARDIEKLRGESEPVAWPDGASADEILKYVRYCASCWMPDARLLGNARAGDIVRALDSVLNNETE